MDSFKSLSETCSECWLEIRTVSMYSALLSLYFIETCDLPSGLKKGIELFFSFFLLKL